jgi:hypothetical protein
MTNHMIDRLSGVLNVVTEGREKLGQVLDRLRPEDWNLVVQGEDQKWTIRQIVSHLVDAQKGMMGQAKAFQEGKEVVPPDFDLNRWNKRAVEKMAEKTPEELLNQLHEGHTALKNFIGTLEDADLDKSGRHSSLQIMTIEQIIQQIGQHEAEHAQTIAETLDR